MSLNVVTPIPKEELPNPPNGTEWYWAACGMWALKSNGKSSSYYIRHSTPFFPDMCPERDNIQFLLRIANGIAVENYGDISCKDCKFWYEVYEGGPHNCRHPKGMTDTKQDGSSYCSERKRR